LDQDQKLDRMITYSFFSFQCADLEMVLQKAKANECEPFQNLAKNQQKVNTDAQACYLGILNRKGCTYILYAYKYRHKEYGFVWESYCDDRDEMDTEATWYDFIEQGQYFKIRIDKDNPDIHYIKERPFTGMNRTVIQIGPCRET